jgi:hypothetical protein
VGFYALEYLEQALPLWRSLRAPNDEYVEAATALSRVLLGPVADQLGKKRLRVVVSLWDVHDRATAELMKRFYQGMLGPERLRPAAALRAAQVSLWKDQQWSMPYYWPAFVLQGEWK